MSEETKDYHHVAHERVRERTQQYLLSYSAFIQRVGVVVEQERTHTDDVIIFSEAA